MAVPVCPDCGTTIEPNWDWCQSCGFDPEGVRPPDWAPATGARTVFPVAEDVRRPVATTGGNATDTSSEVPPARLRPHDLLRPRVDAPAASATTGPPAGPLTGPLTTAEPETEHRPLTLDDLRRSTPSASAPDAPVAREPSVPPTDVAPPPLAPRVAAPRRPAGERPPLFPPVPSASETPTSVDLDEPFEPGASDEPEEVVEREPAQDAHPYFDLPYDDPTAPPGSEPEPEPTSRLRRRRSANDDRPNAATMAMASGRIASDGPVADAPATAPPPPPPPGGDPVDEPAPAPAAASPPASGPGDSSSLGPIVFGPAVSPVPSLATRAPKRKSSPLSVAAILMTIAIAAIVLWPTYRNLVDSEPGPALPPPSAGAIGYAPAGADGTRAPIDPQKTASWSTSAPPDARFEVDMPGVVIIRTRTIPVDGGSGQGIVASSSSGRGGYVVAAIDPPADKPWTTLQQAADAVLVGFNATTGNELKAGAPTTLGGQPAITVEGTVDSVPSKGAIVLVGNRAYLAVAGNATAANLDRFLTSFRTVP